MGADKHVWEAESDCVCFGGQLVLADLEVVILGLQAENLQDVVHAERHQDLVLLDPDYLTYHGLVLAHYTRVTSILQIHTEDLTIGQPSECQLV